MQLMHATLSLTDKGTYHCHLNRPKARLFTSDVYGKTCKSVPLKVREENQCKLGKAAVVVCVA